MEEEFLASGGSQHGDYYVNDYDYLWEKIVKDKELYCAINFTLIHEYPSSG